LKTNGDAAVLVEHRLLTARQIDNSETPHSEASGFVDPFPRPHQDLDVKLARSGEQ